MSKRGRERGGGAPHDQLTCSEPASLHPPSARDPKEGPGHAPRKSDTVRAPVSSSRSAEYTLKSPQQTCTKSRDVMPRSTAAHKYGKHTHRVILVVFQ